MTDEIKSAEPGPDNECNETDCDQSGCTMNEVVSKGIGPCFRCDRDFPVTLNRNSLCPDCFKGDFAVGRELTNEEKKQWKSWVSIQDARTGGRFTNPFKEDANEVSRESQQIAIRVRNKRFLRNPPVKSVTYTKQQMSLQVYYQQRDKKMVRILSSTAGTGGMQEKTYEWSYRMGVKTPRGDDIDRRRHTNQDMARCPHCENTNLNAHLETYFRNDILGPAKHVLREWAYRDQEAYVQYVEDLEEEMGPHFDESLVL